MKRTLLTALTIGGFAFCLSCDKSTEPASNQSSFQANVNGIQKSGLGIAFLYSDTLLHIRGKFAENGFERHINIVIDTVASGKYQILKNNGSLVDIIGGDAITNRHSTFGLPNDTLSYEINFSKKHLTGNLNAIFVDSLTNDTLTLKNGLFDIYY